MAHVTFNKSEVACYYRTRVPDLKQITAREWRGSCPVHQGERDSFAVNPETGEAFCHSQCGRGWGVVGLEVELTGAGFKEARAEVFRIIGRPEERDLPTKKTDLRAYKALEVIYDYTDEEGRLLYQVLRYRLPNGDKDFSQRKPAGNGWSYITRDLTKVPYRLPELVNAEFVFIVEGEKDVDNLRRVELTATTNPEGAKKFQPELVPWFKGKRVCILPDNDDKGREHAQMVAHALNGTAKSIKVVELPGLAEKGDVSDFLAAGGTVAELRRLYAEAPYWQAESHPHPDDKYIGTLRSEIQAVGGLDKFWDFTQQRGIETPFERLTVSLGGGLLPAGLYLLGGDTGSGKTSLGLQFATKALRDKHGVLLFSIEMSRKSALHRMIAIEALVNLNRFRDLQRRGRTDGESVERLNRKTSEFLGMPLVVSTRGSVTPNHIISEVRRMKERMPNLDLVIVDHLQLMAADERVAGEYEKFTAISRSLKQAAIEIDIPVLCMAQTTRAHSRDHRTELEIADLRGSGALEEDADSVMLIYPDHDDVTLAKDENNGRFEHGPIKTWLKVGKARFGSTGLYLPLMHSKQFTRFDEWISEETV